MPRVIAVGQRYAGDDGVGLAVADALRERGVEVEVRGDAAALVDDLGLPEPVVLVDAVVGGAAPGAVVVLDGYALGAAAARPVSSHGMSVADAIDLAVTLHPDTRAAWLAIVGIHIAPPSGVSEGLSDAVAAAVPLAVRHVLERIGAP